jgi:hypothetical protein
MDTSLRERTAQNARSFKLSDRFERCVNSFFANSLIALHSFSFAQKIKDHSLLLSVRSIYKSDVPSSANLPPVSTTLLKLVAKFAAGVVDTGGKIAAGVIDTGGKFATGVVDTGVVNL